MELIKYHKIKPRRRTSQPSAVLNVSSDTPLPASFTRRMRGFLIRAFGHFFLKREKDTIDGE